MFHILDGRIFRKHKAYLITSLLKTFQWFPIAVIIKFKFLNVAYKVIYPLVTIYCAIPLMFYSPLFQPPFCLLNMPSAFSFEDICNCSLNLRTSLTLVITCWGLCLSQFSYIITLQIVFPELKYKLTTYPSPWVTLYTLLYFLCNTSVNGITFFVYFFIACLPWLESKPHGCSNFVFFTIIFSVFKIVLGKMKVINKY